MPVPDRVLRSGERGWSFLETAVAIIVLGVMSALAAKPLNGLLLRIKLQGYANGVKNVLLNARLRSVANPDLQCGVVFRLTASPTLNDTVFSFLDATADKVYVRNRDSLYLAPFIVKGADRITTSIPAGFPTTVVFRGDGSANASARIVLSLGGMTDTVDVLASTGRIRVVSR
jgi:hypothetical protein